MNVIKYQNIAHKSASVSLCNPGSVFSEQICLPALLMKKHAALHNIDWMQRFANETAVCLAPHAKTSMTPWLLQQQLAAGAWGLTVATPYQACVAAEVGAEHILLANQLVGTANCELISQLLTAGKTVFVFVDNADNAIALSQSFAGKEQRLPVLIELGTAGGRSGCRDNQQALALAHQINQLPGLCLAGLSFYEGVVSDSDSAASIKTFVQRAAALAKALYRQQLLQHPTTLITGAGSVWYDIVERELNRSTLPENMKIVIRPGCYVSHDHGIYQQAQQQILQRSTQVKRLGPPLQNTLEIAAYVQSVPEHGLAIIGLGKRDAAFDAGLPAIRKIYRSGKLLADFAIPSTTYRIMDQHCFWKYPAEISPQVGDIVLAVTSHPCLTFDKWRTFWLIDENYTLLQAVDTCF